MNILFLTRDEIINDLLDTVLEQNNITEMMDNELIDLWMQHCSNIDTNNWHLIENRTININDKILHEIFSYTKPIYNDCGYPDRYKHEDFCRMHGYGIEGKDACDYPNGCTWFENDKCPFYNREEMIKEIQNK